MSAHLGPYRILRLVDRGGQGRVYLGYDERLRRRVAIKIHDLPRDAATRRNLLLEARTVAELDSPKIVAVYDIIESREHLAMVMEYVPGCSLEDFLRRVRPSLASAMLVGLDVAGALAAARERRIIHGDLKGANVLVTRAGRARLSDFGVARNALSTGSGAGSLSALSPEQCRGEVATEESDLFALGVLLYRMLSGFHPFVGSAGMVDREALLAARCDPLRAVVPADVEVPDELSALVQALLQRDPEQRPANTRSVRQTLRGVLRELPVTAQRSLAAEARPCFRDESPGDIPVQMPAELLRDGRSRLQPGDGPAGRLLFWLRELSWPGRFALAALGCALLLPVLLLTRLAGTDTVSFERPILQYSAAATPAHMVSERWLLEQAKSALGESPGRYKIVGAHGAQSLPPLGSAPRPRALAPPPAAEHNIRMSLRCLQQFCVVAVARETGGRHYNAQTVVFSDAAEAVWKQSVSGAVSALFP